VKPTNSPGRKTLIVLNMIILLILAAATVGQILAIKDVREETRIQLEALQSHHVQQQANAVEALIMDHYLELQVLPRGLPVTADATPALIERMQEWLATSGQQLVKGLVLIDREGNFQKTLPEGAMQSLGIPHHLLSPQQQWLETGQTCQLISGEESTYAHLFVILRNQGDWLGTLNLFIDITQFIRGQTLTSPPGGEFLAIVDQKGHLLLDSIGQQPDVATAEQSEPILFGSMPLRQALARGAVYSQVIDPAAESIFKQFGVTDPALISLAPIHLGGQTWSMLFSLPTDRLYPPLQSTRLLTLALALTWLGCGALMVLVWLKNRRLRGYADQVVTFSASQDQLQEDLEVMRSRCNQLLHNTGEAVFIIDPENGQLLEINRQTEETLGYSCGEIRQLSLKALFPGRQRRRFLRLVQQVRNKGQGEEPELQFRRKDGSLFIGAVTARNGWLGNRRAIFGSFHDVTPGIKQAEELRRHNRQLSLLNEISQRVAEGHDLPSILSIILNLVIDSLGVSGGGIFLLQNQATEMQLVIHRDIPPEVLKDLSAMKPGQGLAGRVITTGRPKLSTNIANDHRRISTAVVADGWVGFLVVPLIVEERTVGALFIFDRGNRVMTRDDIRLMQAIGRQVGPLVKNAELFDELQWQHRINQATMRELERSRSTLRNNFSQLEQNHRMLQSLDQMKSSFLALASHELRTPLTSILAGVELLQSTGLDDRSDDRMKVLNTIQNGGLRLKDIIGDLFEAARLESRSLYLAREPFNPMTLINDLFDEYRPLCEEREIRFELGVFPDDCCLTGDAHHLHKALARLMENASKFTPPGGSIRIEGKICRINEVEQQRERLTPFATDFFESLHADEYLEINIIDSGIGLAAEDRLRVFDSFVEVGDIGSHSTSTARFGGKGVGLGLTLAKGVIEAHSGLIWVDSEGPDQGSCFSILLPTCPTGSLPHASD
jgi:PAS domain S-box-containing protein